MTSVHALAAALMLAASVATAAGQSSSLYVRQPELPPPPVAVAASVVDAAAPSTAGFSFLAVPPPSRRTYADDDLITIIIRETTSSDWEASLETDKDAKFEAEVADLPDILDVLHWWFEENDTLGIDYRSGFTGDGDLTRSETITGRVQARVIDVRPNGTLVLEARKFNQVDDETLTLTLTGTCRVDDVSVDNTILSSQMYDLHLSKVHTGELRKASKKGVITRVVEFLFNF